MEKCDTQATTPFYLSETFLLAHFGCGLNFSIPPLTVMFDVASDIDTFFVLPASTHDK
jgi:hypothetical protein